MHDALNQIRTQAVIKMSVNTKENWRLRAHLLIASYFADLSEAEDLLSVKRVCTTSSPCCRCQMGHDDLASGIHGTPRTVNNSLDIVQKIAFGDKDAEQLISKLSMLLLLPIFSSFQW